MNIKNTDNKTISNIAALFNCPAKISIIPHENPDGDAIGSTLGLGQVLKNTGHQVQVMPVNNYPDFLKWFSSDVPVAIYEKNKKAVKQFLFESDVLICMDFNDEKRAGNLSKFIHAFDKTKILIDHHPHPVGFCDYMVSEPHYSSTAELVFDLLSRINLAQHITLPAAEALYTGILTDTGGFNHNTSQNTFRVVANLLDYGINTAQIQSAVFHNFSVERMKLLGYCLNEKMQVFPEYRAALISITQEELERFNFKPGDTEGLVNYPLSIGNIVFSALFIEKKDYIKASFRSKGDFPANNFSRDNFNGGGHRNAAGGESKQSLPQTLERFEQLLPEYKALLLNTKI